MEKKVKLRRFFPGSNSAYGFCSFFNQIADPKTSRTYIIKGGPGSGKSTFMNKIGKEMQKQGLAVEYHHCATDHVSLDGLVVPDLKIAFIDGNSPHVVDPCYPGATGEIIHFGQFWDEAGIRKNKSSVIRLNAEAKRLFNQSYKVLAAARMYLQALENYENIEGVLDQGSWNDLALQLMEEILFTKNPKGLPGKTRRLFVSAISPAGTINFLASLVAGLDKVYILQGDNGAAKDKLLKRMADAACMSGFNIEAYHCAFDPHRIDHLIIPELSTAIINSKEPHCFSIPGAGQEINTAVFTKLSPSLQEEKQLLHKKFQAILSQAIFFLAKAKSRRDELEKLYIPNIDFAGIDQLREKTVERILDS